MRVRSCLLVCLLLAVRPLAAQDPADPLSELVAQERLRSIVEEAYASVTEARITYPDDTAFVEAYTDIAWELGQVDPGIVPLLANEAMQGDPTTFYLAVYGLALQRTPEAIASLYEAIERAENDDSGFARTRKAQLVWALAVAGDVRALSVADAGRHLVGDFGMVRGTSTLEMAAIARTPESVELLNAELLEAGLPQPEDRLRTLYALRAIQRIGHPSSLQALLRWIQSDSSMGRVEAVQGLGYLRDAKATEALFTALSDDHPSVRTLAARAIALQSPAGKFEAIAEALGKAEPQPRAELYGTLVALDPVAALPILTRYAPSPNGAERIAICKAASTIGIPAMDLLIQQVADPAMQAGVCAIEALARLDSPRARRVVIRAVDSPNWPLALTASRLAADRRWFDAGETMRRRLEKREFPKMLRDHKDRRWSEWLIRQLTRLEDLAAIPLFEQALETQREPLLREALETALRKLHAVREAADDLEKWEALATGEDEELRRIAYRHLGRGLHGDGDATLLRLALSRAEPEEGAAILDELGGIDSDVSRDVVERILTAPEYQRPELYALRDMAAWSARRLGGERMTAALRKSIKIRHARDVRPIVYYALLSGAAAIPLIESVLPARMRFNTAFKGREHDTLRKLIIALADGRTLDALDRPPTEIKFF